MPSDQRAPMGRLCLALRRKGRFAAGLALALAIAAFQSVVGCSKAIDPPPRHQAFRPIGPVERSSPGRDAIEGLLAEGRNAEAAETARQAVIDSAREWAKSAGALKLWAIARFRTGQPLDDPEIIAAAARLAASEPAARSIQFWLDALAGRAPFSVEQSSAEPIELRLADADEFSLPGELVAVQLSVGDRPLPRVFLDTGSTHTILSTAAAEAVGALVGPAEFDLVGFTGQRLRAGLLSSLELGGLTLHDVPVLVGDWPPLDTAGGQMTLGTDLMHHVCFTIDYPARRVYATAYKNREDGPTPDHEIPLLTYSNISLAMASVNDDLAARVLVDTGNRAGTFVSARWASRNLERRKRPDATLIFQFRHRDWMLDRMALGTLELVDWPVVGNLPDELEQSDALDVLVGHDLLGKYQVTVNMARRVIELCEPDEQGRLSRAVRREN